MSRVLPQSEYVVAPAFRERLMPHKMDKKNSEIEFSEFFLVKWMQPLLTT